MSVPDRRFSHSPLLTGYSFTQLNITQLDDVNDLGLAHQHLQIGSQVLPKVTHTLADIAHFVLDYTTVEDFTMAAIDTEHARQLKLKNP